MLSTGQFLLSGFCWKLNTSGAVLAHNSVADSDLELKRGVRGGGGGGGGGLFCAACPAGRFPSLGNHSKEGGEAQDHGPLT